MARSPRPIDADIANGLSVLRARSRELAQNSDHVRGFLRLLRTNVAGPRGHVLQAKVMNSPPQDPTTLDTAANEAIEAAWERQGFAENWLVSGALTRTEWEWLHVQTVARDGEALYRKHAGFQGSEFRFALEPLDCETLPVDYSRELSNGRRIRMGVELDRYHRPVAYHFRTLAGTGYDYLHSGARMVVIPARDIVHCFMREDALQTRGVPWTAAAMLRLNMLAGYEEAEVTAARAAASKMGFYEQGPDATGDFEDELDERAEAGQVDAYGNLLEHAEAGVLEVLPKGVTFQTYDPQHPNSAYGDFVKSAMRSVSAGLGASYSSLTNDWQSGSWSSQRQEALEVRDVWMLLQGWVQASVLRPVYEAWLSPALLAGIPLPGVGRLRPEDIERYRRVTWQGRRWQWVDPKSEMDAAGRAVSLGIRSRSSVIRDQGQDPADVFDEIEKERAEMARRNIPIVDPILKQDDDTEAPGNAEADANN